MTLEEVNSMAWKHLRIILLDGKYVIIFIYETELDSKKAFALMKKTNFDLNVFIQTSGQVVFKMNLIDFDKAVLYESNATEEGYPAFKWLKQGLVHHYTCGVMNPDSTIAYDRDFQPLQFTWNMN